MFDFGFHNYLQHGFPKARSYSISQPVSHSLQAQNVTKAVLHLGRLRS